MAIRYEVIKSIKDEYYCANYPLLLSAHALIKDTVTDILFAQCKYVNLSDAVEAVYVSVSCIGADGSAVESVNEYVYLDLKTKPGESFGDDKLIMLPNKTTRSFAVILKKVVYSSGEVWQAPDNNAFLLISDKPKPLSDLGQLADQYRRTMPTAQSNIPEKHKQYWRCGCGLINLNKNNICVRCNNSIENQLAALDKETLQQQQNDYNAKVEKEAVEIREAEERVRLKRKKIRIALIASLSVVAITTLALIIVFIIYNDINKENKIKEYKIAYETAFEMISTCDASESAIQEIKAVFDGLADYKDASSWSKKCDEAVKWSGTWYFTHPYNGEQSKEIFVEFNYLQGKMRGNSSEDEWDWDCAFSDNIATMLFSDGDVVASYSLYSDEITERFYDNDTGRFETDTYIYTR
ncbi:hypothetical protein FACS1894105_00370 [Clostridia bacterium]|nr:hypothetical protein FACS1894105_00370 [Clostridia bacterium]